MYLNGQGWGQGNGTFEDTMLVRGASLTLSGTAVARGPTVSGGWIEEHKDHYDFEDYGIWYVNTYRATQTLSGGALAYDTAVLDGGAVVVAAGATASGTVLSGASSGTCHEDGADPYDATVHDWVVRSEQTVQSGGSAAGAVVREGARQVVEQGGTATGTTISGGGSEDLAGTEMSGKVLAGGLMNVS